MKLKKALLLPFFLAFAGIWIVGALLVYFCKKVWSSVSHLRRVPLRWEVVGFYKDKGVFKEL